MAVAGRDGDLFQPAIARTRTVGSCSESWSVQAGSHDGSLWLQRTDFAGGCCSEIPLKFSSQVLAKVLPEQGLV